jgi:oligopeptidase B
MTAIKPIAILALVAALATGVCIASYAESTAPRPPLARIEPKVLEAHGQRRIDNYDWLSHRESAEVIAHLQAENAYTEARLAPLRPLIDDIAGELRARFAPADVTVPYFDNGYFYQRRFGAGASYPHIVRRKGSLEAPEETVLDVTALAAGHTHYSLGRWAVSRDGQRVAFSVDFHGNRVHRIFVRNIATGEVADQGIDGVNSEVVLAADGETLFYVRQEDQTLRAHQVWRHRIGTDPAGDVLVYEETDPTFTVTVRLTKSRKFVTIVVRKDRTSETRFLPADQPEGTFTVIEPRQEGVRYEADHVGSAFYIRTNRDAPDFRIVRAPETAPGAANWQELIAERPGHYLTRLELFERYLAIDVDHDAISSIRAFRLADMSEIPVPRPSEIGIASTAMFRSPANRDPASKVLRFHFISPVHPETVYDFDLESGTLTELKRDPAYAWLKPERYAAERIFADAPDGERVPITLVYRKDLRRPGGNPTVINGYGAYGISWRPGFPLAAFSLIDRGFVHAVAHVRGGREKGERWYESGRVLTKRNSFNDFIAVSERLIAAGYAARGAVFARGGSAGGLLVGSVANLRPDLYAGIVAEVPFVDVVTTMSDPSIPLTTLEYDEWGNPADRRQFDYMLSYSPYDNVAARRYPAMFVTAGLHDSQVSYAEPAKWVAKLRALGSSPELLFRTELQAGHTGASGRLGSVDEEARIQAWLVARVGAPH